MYSKGDRNKIKKSATIIGSHHNSLKKKKSLGSAYEAKILKGEYTGVIWPND